LPRGGRLRSSDSAADHSCWRPARPGTRVVTGRVGCPDRVREAVALGRTELGAACSRAKALAVRLSPVGMRIEDALASLCSPTGWVDLEVCILEHLEHDQPSAGLPDPVRCPSSPGACVPRPAGVRSWPPTSHTASPRSTRRGRARVALSRATISGRNEATRLPAGASIAAHTLRSVTMTSSPYTGRSRLPRRRHRPPERGPQRPARVFTMPARQLAQLVQDHRLRGLGRRPIPRG
jgi:hypothetical protein